MDGEKRMNKEEKGLEREGKENTRGLIQATYTHLNDDGIYPYHSIFTIQGHRSISVLQLEACTIYHADCVAKRLITSRRQIWIQENIDGSFTAVYLLILLIFMQFFFSDWYIPIQAIVVGMSGSA